MLARVAPFAAALWWGSLTAVGFVVVPLLFKFLPTPAMAGHMAARLFTAQTWCRFFAAWCCCWFQGQIGRQSRRDVRKQLLFS